MDSRPAIHFNPKFKNAHINPNFIQQPSKILINPRFLLQQNDYQSSTHEIFSRPTEILPTLQSTAIIRNTRRTLIRAPAVSKPPIPSTSKLPPVEHPSNCKNLIKIGKNKLVTAAHLVRVQQKENEIIKSKSESFIKTKKLKRMETEPKSIYKIDRRHEDPIGSRRKIVRKYSIKRVEPKTPLSLKKAKINTSLVNGFSPSKVIKSIYSRNYRSHLSTIKTRSISLLNKSSTRKSNEICPIFRRLGKCLAHKRARCHKVHDKNYVIVCSKYLRGACQDENCLLSHDTSFKKMPVCKYFLQGLCHNQDCRYLHKKLSDDTSLCIDFVKGFCAEGDKCKFLHDHPEVNSEARKKFSIVRKKVEKSKDKQNDQIRPVTSSEQQHNRYFVNDEQPNESIIPQKKKFESLPSYIPL